MASIEPAALHLRFRQDARAAEPADVAAFLPSTAGGRARPPRQEIAVVPGARPVDPEGPLTVFIQRPDFGIPGLGAGRSLPDLGAWSMRSTEFGWIARVTPARRGAGPRSVVVLAGCLALAMPLPAAAAASEPGVQAPTTKAAKVEPARREPNLQPALDPKPALDPQTTPDPPSAPASAPAPTVSPVPSAISGSTALGPAAVADAAWEGVDGFDVVLDLKGGKTLRGRVGAVQADTFTLIEGTTGQVLVLAKSGVATLRAYVAPPIPSKTGTGMLVGGGVLTSIGAPIFVSGVAFLGICPSCTYIHLPLLIIGAGALGGGIPLLLKGAKRRAAFNKAVEEHRVTPTVLRSRDGWSGGLSLRF